MAGRKRRIILRIAVALVLLLVALMVALPLWFQWVLKPAAKSLHLSYANYERVGYSRFQLTSLALTNKSAILHARKAEAYVPTVWLWKIISHETNRPFLQIGTWEYLAVIKSNHAPSAPPASAYTNIAKLNQTLATLDTWLPSAEFTNGSVQISGKPVAIRSAHWNNGALTADVLPAKEFPVALTFKHRRQQPIQLSINAPTRHLGSDWSVSSADTLRIDGTVTWQSNQVQITTEFPRDSSLPSTAALRAEHFDIPGEAVQLANYRNVTGTLDARWASNRFAIDLSAVAEPLSDDLSPIDLQIHASGDTNRATVDTAKVVLPWLHAELTERTTLQFHPPFLPEPTQLKISADLAKQGRIIGSGTLEGDARMYPTDEKYPRLDFVLNGENVTVSNIQSRTLELRGELAWPEAKLDSTRIEMQDGSVALLTASMNLSNKTVASGELRFSGQSGTAYLPKGYSFSNASSRIEFSGPFAALTNIGTLQITNLVTPQTRPLQLAAEWSARGKEINQGKLRINAGDSSLRLTASAASTNRSLVLKLSEFSLHTGKNEDLQLAQPAQLRFTKLNPTTATNLWTLEAQPFRWAGTNRTLELEGDVVWPERGRFRIAGQNLTSDLLEDFLTITNTRVTLDQLVVNGSWSNSPLTFRFESAAQLDTKKGYVFLFHGVANADADGIKVPELTISSATQTICRAEGTLPFVIHPGNTNGLLIMKSDGVLRWSAFTETNSVFWDELAARSRLNLRTPRLTVDVSGTWAKPQGVMQLSAERIEIRNNKPMPRVDNLNFDLKMNREMADAHLTMRVQDQSVIADARLPLGRGFWEGLRRTHKLPDTREATGELSIQNAQIAPFAEFVPTILAPQGEFSLNVKLSPGNQLSGDALLYNATTRPLPSLGPVRSIDGKILFAGRAVVLTNLSGEIGGQRITARGSAQLTDSFMLRKTVIPPFDLRVIGTNVPLVRQASVIVRADLNLVITNTAQAMGTINGNVRLRDSFFLSSLKGLAPGKVASPKRRPPYFSVEVEPFAEWKLGVDVTGEKFLRVQSPFFRGVASTTMRMEGSLKEPLALGEVRINSGLITFPFGNLQVQQGFVSLTSADPYRPRLFVNATAQRMGYDIKLEASGPADQPTLQFSSSPPLSSEQIVLMLTTGQTPQGMATSTTTRQRAQGLALFVGKNILTDLGLSGNGEERLTIRSGEEVTETGKPTYDVEYKLTDDWSVVGEYDRFNQYNLGLKWRVYTK